MLPEKGAALVVVGDGEAGTLHAIVGQHASRGKGTLNQVARLPKASTPIIGTMKPINSAAAVSAGRLA